MARQLSPWCKMAKHALIDRDMSVADLAHENWQDKRVYIWRCEWKDICRANSQVD